MERIIVIFCILLITLVNSMESKLTKIHPLKYRSTKDLDILAEEFNAPLTFKDYVKPLLIPRMPDTEGIEIVRNFITKVLTNLNWKVEIDNFESRTPYGMRNFSNIIATYDPTKPRRLVLAAHYDSKNISKNGQFFIAATDSAVPCAILLDMATQLECLMSKGNGKLADDMTVQLVFFDGEEAFLEWTEEDSLYGARHLADKWERENQLQNIHMLVLLDLIGSRDVHFQSFFEETEPYFEALDKIERQLATNGFLNPEGLRRNGKLFHLSRFGHQYYGGIEDDHIPFMRKGIHILHLISVPFPSVWHKMADNEKAIDYDVTDNFNRIFRVFVANFFHLDTKHSVCRKKKK